MVIYHSPCQDGWGARLACYLRWPNAVYVPANYGNPPPDVAGLNVLIVDFSYKEGVLRDMARVASSIVVLDHHKTAKEDLFRYQVAGTESGEFNYLTAPLELIGAADSEEPLPLVALFDMERSGAMLAWNFAHPDEPAPALIEAIQDRDLWRFNLPHSKALATLLRTVPDDVMHWHALLMTPFEQLVAEAHPMQVYHDSLVEALAEKAELVTIDGVDFVRANVPYMFASDVGHLLLERNPGTAAMTWSDGNGYRHVSLRSLDDRKDVSDFAKKYGGGGHRNAAGYRVPL
jgi:oligoribonuclease NrnB/cAMP/cGMP phosphodiesterase (DHH superfamily)